MKYDEEKGLFDCLLIENLYLCRHNHKKVFV